MILEHFNTHLSYDTTVSLHTRTHTRTHTHSHTHSLPPPHTIIYLTGSLLCSFHKMHHHLKMICSCSFYSVCVGSGSSTTD